MKEITLYRFHDILYKFFLSLTLFGLGMFVIDMITLANRLPLFMFGKPMTGWYNLIPLALTMLFILISGVLAKNHLKGARLAKWR